MIINARFVDALRVVHFPFNQQFLDTMQTSSNRKFKFFDEILMLSELLSNRGCKRIFKSKIMSYAKRIIFKKGRLFSVTTSKTNVSNCLRKFHKIDYLRLLSSH
jgi:hypothetical protein